MNKYKNPRLKHVEKIREALGNINPDLLSVTIVEIRNQCNLLLETKKVNKQKLPKHYALLNKAVRRWLEGGHTHDNNDPLKPSPQPETKKKKKCKNCGLVFSLKSWKKCPMCNPSPQPKPFAQEVSEFVNGNNDKPFPQPEIEKVAENDGEWCTGGKVSITYGQREEMLREKLNEVIDRLNKLTKTK